MESDKKLDRLESFLGRLNSKGVYITRGVYVISHFLLDGQSVWFFSHVVPSGRSAGNHSHSH